MFLVLAGLTLSQGSEIASIVVAASTTGALIYAAVQVRLSRRVSTADLFLRLHEMLLTYDAVHTKLAEGEELSPTDWYSLSRYMGLMEQIKVLLDKGLLDIRTVDRLYGFRMRTVLHDPQVREWLEKDSRNWRDLIILGEALDRYRASAG